MKKILSLILASTICLSCVACGGSGTKNEMVKQGTVVEPVKQSSVYELPKDIQMYVPGSSIKTDFGSITIMDAAFCEKAQLYFTKNSRSSKTTINGKTTESYEEFIYPGYISMMDGKLIFALKTVLVNNSGNDIEVRNLSVKAFFTEDEPVYFSTGGNYEISDEAYSSLPNGASGEYIFAALLPVEQYQNASGCLLEVGSEQLGFPYDSINIYNALGFQTDDNTVVTIDNLLKTAADAAAPTDANTEGKSETQPSDVDVKYYREASELPTVDSVTGLELFHSANDSNNGKITRMRYYYKAKSGQTNGPDLIEQYLTYLRENGYTLKEDGINVDVSLNGKPLASLQITGMSMEARIDLGEANPQNGDIPEIRTVSKGETVILDFVEFTVEGIARAAEIREDDGKNTYHRRPSNSKNQMFWLQTTMKNIGTETFSLFGINKYFAEIVFDDKYTYEANIDKMVGMGNTELKPFESAKVYIWAEIPIEMLDNAKTVSIRFGFNDNFDRADEKAFDCMKNRFEYNG